MDELINESTTKSGGASAESKTFLEMGNSILK